MPTAEEQISLAEIVRTMKDFREEFRTAISTMMRADVYAAQQATLRAEIAASEANFKAEIAALNTKTEAEIAALKTRTEALQQIIESHDSEKRQSRGLIIGAFGSAAVALLLQVFGWKG